MTRYLPRAVTQWASWKRPVSYTHLDVYKRQGEYHDLTGNMSGCLLANDELSQRKAVNGSLPEDGALVKTIVTTNLADAIAKGYGVNPVSYTHLDVYKRQMYTSVRTTPFTAQNSKNFQTQKARLW